MVSASAVWAGEVAFQASGTMRTWEGIQQQPRRVQRFWLLLGEHHRLQFCRGKKRGQLLGLYLTQ